MRRIRKSKKFKQDYKLVKRNPQYKEIVDLILIEVLELLCDDQQLPESYKDHKLIGNWRGYRECHLKADLLLIYCQTRDGCELKLARIGSHSELF